MKQKFIPSILIFVLMLLSTSYAQNEILNAGFENWNNGKAQHWLSTNIPNNIATNVTQTTDAHSGSFAITGEVQLVFNADFVPGIFTGYNESVVESGFPVTQKYQSFSGYYKFIRGGSIQDVFLVVATLTNQSGGVRIAEAEMELLPAGEYTFFDIPFVYDPANLSMDPEVVHISIVIDETPDGDVNQGSTFFVDDLSFGGTTSVGLNSDIIPNQFKLEQNYPNPFNPTTQINFSLPEHSNVELSIYNMLGEKVATLLNENLQAGNYSTNWNAENISSGNYIYRISSGNYVESKMMTLLK